MHFSAIVGLAIGAVLLIAIVRAVWSAVSEGAREGLAEARAELAADKAAKAAALAATTAEAEAELAGCTPAERRGILLQAMFREFLFNGPLTPLRWPAERRIWLRTWRLPPEQLGATREALAKEWGIDGPETLRERIEWLLREGHRGDVADIFGLADPEVDPAVLDDLSRAGRAAVTTARAARERVGDARGDAFDIARAALLVAGGMALGELDIDEGRALLAECDGEAQRTCGNWRQFGESFMAGGEIWMTLSDVSFAGVTRGWWRKTISWLGDDPASPWRAEPWPVTPPDEPRTLH